MSGLPDLRNCPRWERISCIWAQPIEVPRGSKTTALIRESAAARRNIAQTFSTVTGVLGWRKGREKSTGGGSGGAPPRVRMSVDESSTAGGRERNDAIAKMPMT